MKHDLGIRIGGALLVAVLMAASSLLMAAPALAQTKKALAHVQQNTGRAATAGHTAPLAGYRPARPWEARLHAERLHSERRLK